MHAFGTRAAGHERSLQGFTGHDLSVEGYQGMHDMKARQYISSLGVFGGVDPLVNSMPTYSPYVYGFNNPIGFTDPTGMTPRDIILVLRNSAGEEVERVDYRNDGQIYNTDGTANEGNKSFFTSTVDAINGAQANDSRLDHMFSHLEESKATHEFTSNNPKVESAGSENRRDGTSRGLITQFTLAANRRSAAERGESQSTDTDVAAHEGKHAYNKNFRQIKNRTSSRGAPSDEEVDGINTENINRNAEGRKLRTRFNGRDIAPGRLIIPSTYDPTSKPH